MNEKVRIGALPGDVWQVTLDPPAPSFVASSRFASFDQALGYALGYSIGLSRELIDDTARLSPAECAEMRLALITDSIGEGFKRVARGESFLPPI